MQNKITDIRSFFSRHKAARVLLILLAVLLVLVIALHPHGTKTFLILGIDNYGSLDDNGRSDVMMLVQVGFDKGKIHAVTFARDIVIPDERSHNVKLNTIVRSQDEDALVSALENAFDLKIDGWFRVNFSSVITIIDAMGGVEIDLTEAEAHYIDKKEGTYPDYPLAEGRCRMNGRTGPVLRPLPQAGQRPRARRPADQALLRAGRADPAHECRKCGFRRPRDGSCVAFLSERRGAGEARLSSPLDARRTGRARRRSV